jgi:hypothetical protein
MVYLNSSSRSRNAGSLVNRNQGGGNKKMGFAYQVGRESYTSVIMNSTDPVNGSCCTLKSYMTMPLRSTRFFPRPVGGSVNIARGYYGKF